MYIVFIIIITFGSVIFLANYYSSKKVLIRKLKEIPNASVNNLKTNQLTKITGKALHINEPLIAPFSKRKCVFYRIKIEQKKHNGNTPTWVTVAKEEKIQPFFLMKNGEYVMVQPSQDLKNFKAHLVVDKKHSTSTFNGASPEFQKLLDRYHIKSKAFLGFNKSLRYKEAIVEINEEITVAGIGKWKNLNEPIEGYTYSKIATLESNDNQKLLITDLPKERINKK
ncbi:hypothetical protein [Tenacibaculum jejuense]|uniref:Aspartyl-tRNA synthetase n=1 Tax=Tenacibaculum jejuense TaxID=584609 RepID=A0A238UE02_9FLAO|nr:hypothetical protein [Tenacibaculum jejuense]SNR17433.1 Aspartyl-tRNA synthetase [Tenacibaculum jejuense]